VYKTTIGLEIHAELNTFTKIFCRCLNGGDAEPNANVCPTCLGMPGALPVVSRAAIEKTIMAGLAFGCTINDLAVFERKNYFYPDLPKGYQTTQNDFPICLGGGITLSNGKVIRLNRIHLEEDAGKLLHDEVRGETLIDYNRGGTPLIEIVTEADISSAEEAIEFLEEVRSRLVFSGVSNARMEEGELRFDVNISLSKTKKLGNRIEMKNLNSFKTVARAIEFEIKRQAALLDNDREIVVETRKWNDTKEISTSMRSKEDSADYRYFPDPDQYPIKITRADVAAVKKNLPKLAHELRAYFIKLGLSDYDAEILTREKCLAEFFMDCCADKRITIAPTEIAKWILGDILSRAVNFEILVTPHQLMSVVCLVNSGKITRKNAPALLDAIWSTEKDAAAEAKNLGLLGGVSEDDLVKIIMGIIAANPQAVEDYATKPDKALTFLMGQVMKQTQGKADVVKAREFILQGLG